METAIRQHSTAHISMSYKKRADNRKQQTSQIEQATERLTHGPSVSLSLAQSEYQHSPANGVRPHTMPPLLAQKQAARLLFSKPRKLRLASRCHSLEQTEADCSCFSSKEASRTSLFYRQAANSSLRF